MRRTLYVKASLVVVLTALVGAVYLRLAAGPVGLPEYAGRVGAALAERIGPGWTVSLSNTAVELYGAKPAVRADGLEIRNPAGLVVVRAPFAVVSLDPVSLIGGSFSPREIEFRDIHFRGMIAGDGSLSFEPQVAHEHGGQSRPPPITAPAAEPAARSTGSPVAVALASLLDPIVNASNIVGALDRATIVGARLTLVGEDGRERAAFHRLGAVFQRLANGSRRVEIDLDGQNGPWRVQGDVGEGPDRSAELEVAGVPVADVLLLSGLSQLPAGSDLKLSGRISAAFDNDRLRALTGRFETTAGTITRPGRPPIVVEAASGRASWDEGRRALDISGLDIGSEGTRVSLTGQLAPAADGSWTLRLAGTDAAIAGLTGADPPFKLDAISADLSLREDGVILERATLKGDQLDIELGGALTPGLGGPSLAGTLEVRRTDVRRLVRLWPDGLNPELRTYLATRLEGGVVERLRLRSTLDQRDFKAAFSDVPISDGALELTFAATGASLAVVDGLPPLRDLEIEGRSSGTKASLLARSGRVEMPDGRRLAFTDGSYVHPSLDRKESPAQVSFRLGGGVDAIASLLRSPIIRDANGFDIDPAAVKGRADFVVKLPLVPGRIPPLSELALSVTGSLSEVSADRLFGKEKLDSANLTVGYEAGALSLRGEGRLGGSPATFEMQSPRGGVPEIAIATTLDDAARLRRSLPGPPALAGPVAVKVFASLTPGAKPQARVEADLSRASIDGLVPGWVKAAAKPGRLSFTLIEGDGAELRDLTVDAGSVQIKGQMSLAPAGGVERAELSTFKLSPGDDLRAQVERAPNGPYRITLKGNVGDARPVLKWMIAAKAGGGRESLDVDVDLATNILTGFNDEAMTSVSTKIAARGGELRSVQFAGRFRNALVEAQLAKRDAGSPLLTVRSGDAGATLRFLDLYRRMAGGRLAIDARSGEGVQEGRVVIDDFGLRGEPALRQIVTQASQQQRDSTGDDRGIAPIARSDIDQVLFNKLSADFRKTASRVDYNDVVIYGTQVGFNLSGFVDYARDRLDVSGTFVPAYMLNNAFSQLPVVGILLGGGRNEGLFAVDFRVAGSVASPSLTVNPLTVVAPGILRKLFGWMMPDGAEPARTTGSAPPRRNEN